MKILFYQVCSSTIKLGGGGVRSIFVFFVVGREEKGPKLISSFWFGVVLVQKRPLREANPFSQKWVAETPIFIVFLRTRCLGQVVKRKFLGHPPKKKHLIDNWKAHFLVFLFFLNVFVSVVFWRFKGQVRLPKGPPHLGPKPSLLVLFFFWFSFLCF